MTGIDPSVPFATDRDGRVAERIGALERRIGALERGRPTVVVAAGPPSGAAREGAVAAQTSTPRLWLMVGGVWRYSTLT